MSMEVYIDGACSGNPGPAGIGIVIPEIGYEYSEFIGESTNNIAEATALLTVLRELSRITDGRNTFTIFTDSQLIYEHMKGNWKVKNEELAVIYEKIRAYDQVVDYQLKLVTSAENKADAIAKKVSKSKKTHNAPAIYVDEKVTGDIKFIQASTKLPYYGIEHKPIERMVRIYDYHTDDNGRPIEGGGPTMVAELSEELAIKVLLAAKQGKIKLEDL